MLTQKLVALVVIGAVLSIGAALGGYAIAAVVAQPSANMSNSTSSAGNSTSSAGNSTSSAGGTSVSIVPNASTLADKAFSPDEASVKVGDSITWTNKDTIFHTVTSGTGPSDPNAKKEFDSGLSGPNALTSQGKTFTHKFMTAGEFPYFCQLHPTMVGKVSVK